MPVVVTGAERPLGAAIVAALLAAGVPDLRAVVADRAAALAGATRGVRVSVTDLDDVERLAAACTGAHTVVHLALRPAQTLPLLLDAVEDTGVARLVVVTTAPDAQVAGRLLRATAYDVVVVVAPSLDVVDPGVVDAVLAADRRPGPVS